MKNEGCTKTRISHKVGMSSVHLRHRPDGSLHSRKEIQRYIQLHTNSAGRVDTLVRSVTTTRQYRGNFEYDGSAWIYHTTCGFINLKDNGVHYYARDYQGSTRAVYKSNEVQIAPLALGNGAIVRPNLRTIEQATDYYPSGLPVDVTATVTPSLATAVTDRLHIGNRWMNHAGLSLYDNTARIYDPLTVRFHTPDPLDYKRPWDSPWAHCGGNPANFIDPDGLDVYMFDIDGRLLKVTPDDTQDVIQVEGTSNEYTMPAGSIENYSSAKFKNGGTMYDVRCLQIRGDENGEGAFEFLAQNTQVEWGLAKTGVEGALGKTFLTTSSEKKQRPE